jgi:glycosyltransferase involved in cell wall biosynthesis
VAARQVTIGHFAPFPPAHTGVAEYAEALHTALASICDIRKNDPATDVQLYHIGNNHLHRSIYERALAQPGVVLLHDGVLIHFFLGGLNREAFVDEFVYNYGEWNRDLGASLWDRRSSSGVLPSYFSRPMLRRITESAKAVVVHNSEAARAVLKHSPQARLFEIPHLFAPPAVQPTVEAVKHWRGSHGLRPETVLFGVFGYLRESKRLSSVLQAFELVHSTGRDVALLVAGEFVSPDLEFLLAPRLEGPGIVRVGHLDEPDFHLCASAVDAVINLRYPSAGETSGITIRMMGLGKPVVLTAYDETAPFPENVCLRIEPGVGEAESLAHMLILLADDPADRKLLGTLAARHIRRFHALNRIADELKSILIQI